ncbi:tRNA (adenosine(37)-N6)-threonylcarbamoyltransferase complex ATPase subunit type 1 TsaE [soil metagenome]
MNPPTPELRLPTPADTAALGARIAALLQPGDAVCLEGPLGAGKSVLARGLVRALTSADEEVPSPTFTLVQLYEGAAFPVSQLDLYRLKTPDEAWELGIDEALVTGAVVIEWPQRLGGALPPDRLEIELRADPAAADARLARITGFGSWTERVDRLLRP